MKDRFSIRYYRYLQKKAEYMNEEFKYEGDTKRACVVSGEKGFEIIILVRQNNPLNNLMNQLMEALK